MKKFITFLSVIGILLSLIISSSSVFAIVNSAVKKVKGAIKGAAEPNSLSVVREVANADTPFGIDSINVKEKTGYFLEIKGLNGMRCEVSKVMNFFDKVAVGAIASSSDYFSKDLQKYF